LGLDVTVHLNTEVTLVLVCGMYSVACLSLGLYLGGALPNMQLKLCGFSWALHSYSSVVNKPISYSYHKNLAIASSASWVQFCRRRGFCKRSSVGFSRSLDEEGKLFVWVSFMLSSDLHLGLLCCSHSMGAFSRGVAGRRVFIVITLHATSHRRSLVG